MVPLASSTTYQVRNDYENVYVDAQDGRTWQVGDFYGDPYAALITWDERWAVIVGEGALVIRLDALGDQPLKQITLDTPDVLSSSLQQAASSYPPIVLYRLFRGPSTKVLWIEAVYQPNKESVRFVADPLDEGAG